MLENPLVSVIMPSYNAKNNINEAIDSVMNQTYTEWELIICDDFSNDGTFEILKKINHPKIKVIFHEKNKGVTAARNTAIENSNGDYFAFLDSDDYWLENKLEKQMCFMIKKNILFSCTSYGIVKNSVVQNKKFLSQPVLDYKSYMKNTAIGNSTVIVSKNVYRDFRIEEGPLEDSVTWLKILKKDIKCYGLEPIYTMYRVSDNSESSDKIQNAKKFFNILYRKERVGFMRAVYYESCYMFNALKKRLF